MDISEFLGATVEGYLFEDIKAMKGLTLPSGKMVGAAGYPLAMATFAGIELFGTLLDKNEFDTKKGNSYFCNAWGHIYPQPKHAALGTIIYGLVRNGLAHVYATKGPITIIKGDPNQHLQQTAHMITIDANQLADDLMRTYDSTLKTLLLSGEAQSRLNEMQAVYENATARALGTPVAATPSIPLNPMADTGLTGNSTLSIAASGSVLVPS